VAIIGDTKKKIRVRGRSFRSDGKSHAELREGRAYGGGRNCSPDSRVEVRIGPYQLLYNVLGPHRKRIGRKKEKKKG